MTLLLRFFLYSLMAGHEILMECVALDLYFLRKSSNIPTMRYPHEDLKKSFLKLKVSAIIGKSIKIIKITG